MDIIT